MTDKSFDLGPVEEGQDAQDAYNIRQTLYGVVEGVTVDFRHELLVPGQSKPAPWWHVWGGGLYNIPILLPHEGSYSDEVLRNIKDIPPDFPIVRAEPGDTIFVTSAHRTPSDRPFDHAHDRQNVVATIALRKPDGTIIEAPGELEFYGYSSVRNGVDRDVFDSVLQRIREHVGITSLNDDTLPPLEPDEAFSALSMDEKKTAIRKLRDKSTLLRDAHLAGRYAHNNYLAIEEILPLIPIDVRPKLMSAVDHLANRATKAGFTLAKLETMHAEQVASAPLRNLEKAQAKRRDPRRIVEANALWAKHPKATTNWVAKAIALPHEDVSSVHRSIKHLAPPSSPSFKK